MNIWENVSLRESLYLHYILFKIPNNMQPLVLFYYNLVCFYLSKKKQNFQLVDLLSKATMMISRNLLFTAGYFSICLVISSIRYCLRCFSNWPICLRLHIQGAPPRIAVLGAKNVKMKNNLSGRLPCSCTTIRMYKQQES